MKKFIALVLSVMMVMSLVAVPVMAEDAVVEDTTTSSGDTTTEDTTTGDTTTEDTTTTVVTPATASVEATMWIKASEQHSLLNLNNVVNNSSTAMNFVNSGSAGGTVRAITAGKRLDETKGVFVYSATADGAADVTAWDGFKISADAYTDGDSGGFYTGDPGVSVLVPGSYTSKYYKNKPMRADSVRFKLPDYSNSPDGVLYLLGSSQSWNNIAEADNNTSLRIKKGGAYCVDLNSAASGDSAFIADGTLEADKWYRAERLLDLRIDAGATGDGTENWERFIVYDDTTNAVIGDSGWVKVGNTTRMTGDFKTIPFASMSFGAWHFEEGTYVYIDDIKSWPLDVNSKDYIVGAAEDPGDKWLTFPVDAPSKWVYNHAVIQHAYTTHINDSAFNEAVKNDNYIYFQEDFMIPENVTNDYGFGLMDILKGTSYNSNVTDYGSYTSGYTGGNGVLQVKKDSSGASILKVKEWDGTSLPNGATAAGYYINDVTLKDGSAFALTLTPGEWYTATLKIDQSEYAGKMNHFPDSDTNKGKMALIGDDGETLTLMTTAQTTKATVIIEDSQGNKYETAEFTYKSPVDYASYSSYGSLILIDGRRPKSSTAAASGYKVSVDNVKVVLSNSDIDAEDAYVVYAEEFDNQVTGYNFRQVGNGNANTLSAYAIVEADPTACHIVPAKMEISMGSAIKTDEESLVANVRLYQGDIDVSDQITSMTFDSETKALTLGFGTLEPMTTYTVKMTRNITTAEADIFASLPGTSDLGVYTFTTGYGDTGELIFNPVFKVGIYNIEDDMFGGWYMEGDEIDGTESTLTSYNLSPMNFVAIAANYDNEGKMEDMISQVGTINAGETINLTYNGEKLAASDYTTTVKAFIWNTWRLMKPIAEHYCYPAATAE